MWLASGRHGMCLCLLELVGLPHDGQPIMDAGD